MIDFIQNLNNKYGVTKTALNLVNGAKGIFSKFVEPGKAVVHILEATGIAGFKFHIPESEQVKFESEITDHYTDENEALQDHIALRPVTITLTGLCGEYFYSIHPIEDTLGLITPTLRLVQEYIPKITQLVQSIKAKKGSTTYTVGKNGVLTAGVQTSSLNAVDLFKFFQNLYKFRTAQARAFFYLEALWRARQRFSVETTWKRYDDMVIQSLTAIRDNNADITEFTVTFKQVKFAATQSIEVTSTGRTSLAETDLVKKIEKGQKVEIEGKD